MGCIASCIGSACDCIKDTLCCACSCIGSILGCIKDTCCCACKCVTCTINMLLSIICIVIVVGVVIGLLFVFDVFNTNNKDAKDGAKMITESYEVLKQTLRGEIKLPKCVTVELVHACLSCALSTLFSLLFTILVVAIIVGLLFYYDVFGIQSTNKDAANFFTKTGDDIKHAIKNIS
uniref:CSON005789 protein n=1 Tax=Culicoides sonorensis TaxID=179676 RepID=A0A336LZ37_CULSO